MKKRNAILVSTLLLVAATLYFVFGFDLLPASATKNKAPLGAQGARLRKDVEALFNTPQPRSIEHIESLNAASDYIRTEWEKLGLQVEKQAFKADGKDVHNLVVRLGPQEGKRWVVGAHYDICQEEEESRGADDNASAVAVLLEISRLLVENKVQLKTPLEFVAYTTEEPPYFATELMGSYVHAKSLYDKGIKIEGMISLEMLGYFSEAPGSQEFPTPLLKAFYPSVGNFLMIAGDLKSIGISRRLKNSFRKLSAIPAYSLNAPDVIPGIQFSDHRNYSPFGYSATMLTDTAFYRNKNYHRDTDTPETLNYEKMADISETLAHFLGNP